MTFNPDWYLGGEQGAIAGRPDVQAAIANGTTTPDAWWNSTGVNEAANTRQQTGQDLLSQAGYAPNGQPQGSPQAGGGMNWLQALFSGGSGSPNGWGSSNMPGMDTNQQGPPQGLMGSGTAPQWAGGNPQQDMIQHLDQPPGQGGNMFSYDAQGNISNGPGANQLLGAAQQARPQSYGMQQFGGNPFYGAFGNMGQQQQQPQQMGNPFDVRAAQYANPQQGSPGSAAYNPGTWGQPMAPGMNSIF